METCNIYARNAELHYFSFLKKRIMKGLGLSTLNCTFSGLFK